MIEELDQLAARIKRLVDSMQVLSTEAQTLRQQVAQLQSERDQLAAQLQSGDGQLTELKASLSSARAEAESTRANAEQEKSALQGTLDLFKQEHETIQSDLKAKAHEVKQLRQVNEQAKQRIDGVLERLPGALPQERI